MGTPSRLRRRRASAGAVPCVSPTAGARPVVWPVLVEDVDGAAGLAPLSASRARCRESPTHGEHDERGEHRYHRREIQICLDRRSRGI